MDKDLSEDIQKWLDWDLRTKPFLYNKSLKYSNYTVTDDHDHCRFCWARFSLYMEGDLTAGYYEEESDSWICEECYEIYKPYFHWELI